MDPCPARARNDQHQNAAEGQNPPNDQVQDPDQDQNPPQNQVQDPDQDQNPPNDQVQDAEQGQGQQNMVRRRRRHGSRQEELFTDRTNVVTVLNLSYDTNEEDIYRFFNQFQPVHVRIIYGKSGRPCGTALVEFSDANEADNAIQALDGHQLHDREIRLCRSTKRDIHKYQIGKFSSDMRELEDEYEFKCRRRSITYFASELASEMHEGFAQLNAQFAQRNAQFERLNEQFAQLNGQFTQLNVQFAQRNENIRKLTNRINSMIEVCDKNFLLLSRGQPLNFARASLD